MAKNNREYLRLAGAITGSIWLITEPGLDQILTIYSARINGEQITDEQLAALLESEGGYGSSSERYQISNGIATLPVYGPIFGKANLMTELSGATSMEMFRKDFKTALADDNVKQILLDIDSPGGSSEMIPEAGAEIFAGRDIKPITAIANNEANSAAYWLGSQANKLYAAPGGSVGSVGAYTVHQDQSQADHQQGRKYTIISAGKYKTEGNPHQPLSQEGHDYRQESIDELYGDFVGAIAQGRNISTDEVETNYGQGRVVPYKKALEAGMVDGVMEYDTLIQSLSEQGQAGNTRVSILVPSGVVASAILGSDGIYHLEVADKEHAEPGTGNPPQPAKGDEEKDKAITTGSRHDPLPVAPFDPKAPKPNSSPVNHNASSGGSMDEAQLNELYQLFGVDTEEALIAAITSVHSEATSLRTAVDASSKHLKFAQEYPEEAARMLALENTGRESAATSFADSISKIKRMDGDKLVATEHGISALAHDTIKDTHLKFACGQGSLADFEKAMTVVVNGGIVDYGEHGSAREPEDQIFDASTPQGLANARQQFADMITLIQVNDKLDYEAAMNEAATRYPDLAAAYRTTLPA